MKLNIVKSDADSFAEAFGISEERSLELLTHVETTLEKKTPGLSYNQVDDFNELAEQCNSMEELVYVVSAFSKLWFIEQTSVQEFKAFKNYV